MSEAPKNGSRVVSLLGTALSAVAGAIATGASLWGLVIRPYEERLSRVESQLARFEDRSNSNATSVLALKSEFSAMQLQFGEIETQFDGVAKLRNVQQDVLNRLIVPLWKKIYDIDMPMPQYYPESHDPRQSR